MGRPLNEFRENASRSIFLTGEINEELVHRLTPEICRLKGIGLEPITVYIDSRGGFTLCAEQLRALLTAPNQDGKTCRIITVATTRADSAAAGLLALGDYAIAYPNAAIHCHGSRLSHHEITSERAERLAISLKKSNDDFALRLARRTFARMSFHFANLHSEFPRIRKDAKLQKSGRTMESDLECFAFAIHERLSDDHRELPRKAFFRHERLTDISRAVFSEKLPETENWLETEAELLNRLIKYELELRKDEDWSLSDGGIDELTIDFKSLADYLFGPHQKELEVHLDSFGILFLTPEQLSDYETLEKDKQNEVTEWLRSQARPLVEPMWYFVVSLCRLLQSGEYSLTGTDAYWLGIVDEVIGERLPSLRLIAENPEA